MKKGIQPNTENRLKLSKYCREKGMSPSAFRQLIEPMRGKTEKEKEQIACQLFCSKEVNSL